MDILQNLQSLLGGMGQQTPQSQPHASAGGLGELLNPNVLGSIASALFANKSGVRNMGANAGEMAGGMSSGAGAIGSLLSGLMSGGGGDLLGKLAGELFGGGASSSSGAVSAPPSQASATGDRIRRMVRTLVYAAKADGHIDDQERAVIEGQLNKMNVGPEGQALVQQAMQEPLDPNLIARGVTDQQEALQIYALSCAITDMDQFMERGYLDRLAQALGLAPQVKTAVEAKFARR